MQVAEGMSPTVLTVGPDHTLRAVKGQRLPVHRYRLCSGLWRHFST